MRHRFIVAIAWWLQHSRDRPSPPILPLLIFLVSLLLVPLELTNRAWAAEATVQVEIVPGAVELPIDRHVQILVIVRNSTPHVLRDVRLSLFTNAGVKAPNTDQLKGQDIPAGNTATWIVNLAPAEPRFVPGMVHFRVDYTVPSVGATPATQQVTVGALEVKSRKPDSVEQVVDVQIKTALKALSQQRPGKIYLVVTNKSNTPITVTNITTKKPTFVTFIPPAIPVSLKPSAVRTIEMDIGTDSVVTPERYLLLFEVEIDQVGRKFNTVAATEVDVGVFGESEILTALAVPSFLILPGFLIIVTVGFLWRIGLFKSKDATGQFPLQVNTPEFWLWAIMLSGIMAYVYPRITGRYYLEGYGLGDIVHVWLVSVLLLGAGGYIVGILTFNWYKSRRTPSEDDDQITILEKLDRQDLGFFLDRINMSINGVKQPVFLLQPPDNTRPASWVSPAIVLNWENSTDPDLQAAVENQLNLKERGRAAELARLLKQAQQSGLGVRWKKVGWLNGPYRAKTADLEPGPQKDVFVETE